MVNSGPVAVSRLLGGRLRFLTATLAAAGAALVVQVTGPPRHAVAAILAVAAATVVLLAAQAHDRRHTVRALRARLDQQATETERLVRRAVPAVLAGADPAEHPRAATDPPADARVVAAHHALLRELAEYTRQATARQDAAQQMMATVAGRLQTRLHRVAAELHQLQAAHGLDPALHGRLLRLEHGVRMTGRGALKLAVLGGALPLRQSARPVPLVDVLRVSSAPLAEYARVERHPVPDLAVTGPAVEPLCVVLTELIDNATRFSPPGSPVTLTAARVGPHLEIRVRDRGTGLTEEQHREAELLLRNADPAAPAHSGTVRLGLRVVGLLAARYDFRVRLLPGTAGDVPADGTTACVVLPGYWVTTRRRDLWVTDFGAPQGQGTAGSWAPAPGAAAQAVVAEPAGDEHRQSHGPVPAPRHRHPADAPVAAHWERLGPASEAVESAPAAQASRPATHRAEHRRRPRASEVEGAPRGVGEEPA